MMLKLSILIACFGSTLWPTNEVILLLLSIESLVWDALHCSKIILTKPGNRCYYITTLIPVDT